MTLTKSAPLATVGSQIETLLAELRRLSLESGSAWSETDLTLTQMRALAIVQLRHPMTVGALGSEMGMSLASASALSDRLFRAGLFRRERDASDRRQVLLELEPKATRFLRRIEEHSRTRLRHTLAAMKPHERDALATALGAFIRVLGEDSGGRVR